LLEGMYSAAAGMAAQQQKIDAVSNDLANVNTTGYKRVRVAFRDLLYTPTGPGAVRGVASGAGAAAAQLGRGSAVGALQDTGRPLDIALTGQGFLEVRQGNQRLLTRDGSLQRTDDGRLVTSTGAFTGVTIPANVLDSDVKIGAGGQVTTADGTPLGRLRLVTVRAPEGLEARGDNLFATTAASGAPTAARAGVADVKQSALEASNVDMATAMTDLIEAQRGYEMASKAITTQERLLEIANGIKR
jgi:flagellar basal-body rod protein FlgG